MSHAFLHENFDGDVAITMTVQVKKGQDFVLWLRFKESGSTFKLAG